MNGFEFFKIYHALDLHLNTDRYDVFKYGGRTRITPQSFERRTDKTRYEYWANKIRNDRKAGKFCIANFVHGDPQWLWNPYDQGEDALTRWTSIKESISKVFKDDIQVIERIMDKHSLNIDSLFKPTPSGKHPPIAQIIKAKMITPESAVIIDRELKSYLDNNSVMCHNDPYMEEVVLKLKKYSPFVKYNGSKINATIQEFKAKNV